MDFILTMVVVISSVIGGFGDYRATYWYDGLGNVIRTLYGAGDSNNRYKPYYGYNAESYYPVTGNQNLRNRQLNIRRQRFLTEDTYIGKFTETLSINRYIYGNDNPLKYKDPSGFMSDVIMTKASKTGPGISGCGGGSQGLVSSGMILTSSTLLYGTGIDGNIQQTFKDTIIQGFTGTEIQDTIDPNNILESFRTINNRIDVMINWAIAQANFPAGFWERNYDNANRIDNDVIYNDWYWGVGTKGSKYKWCSVFVIYNGISAQLAEKDIAGNYVENPTAIIPSHEVAKAQGLKVLIIFKNGIKIKIDIFLWKMLKMVHMFHKRVMYSLRIMVLILD